MRSGCLILSEHPSTRELSNSDKIDLPKDVITEAIAKLGKGESVRGESLSLEEFAALSNDLWEKKGR